MGVITGYSRRTAAIGSGGGGGGGGAINTIYSANDTITNDARTVTLKSGGTASQYLQFLNSGGGNLLQLKGDNSIDFGSGTNYATLDFYLNPATENKYTIYRGTTPFIQISASSYVQYMYGTAGNALYLSANEGMYYAIGNNGGIQLYNSAFGLRGNFTLDGSGAQISLQNSANTVIFNVVANGATVIMKGDFGVGVPYASLNARLEVKGKGSTSSTKTALFQNSASVSALTIKDDGYCILRANNAAIASGDLANNEMSFYIDEATNHCVVKVKYSSGTVKTGTFNLT